MTCRLVIVWAAWTRLEEYLPRKLFSSMTTATLLASLSCTSLIGRAHQRVTKSLAPMPFLLSFRALVTTLSFVWTASCSPDPFSTHIQAFSLLYACVSKKGWHLLQAGNARSNKRAPLVRSCRELPLSDFRTVANTEEKVEEDIWSMSRSPM